jgi:LPS export ABC transporter protein LptC
VPENSRQNKSFELRARLPRYVRLAALSLLGVTILAVLVGFYRERSKGAFRLKPEHTRLSTDVVADVDNYERLETDGNTRKFLIRADHAKTFSDQHQELDNVYIEVYGENNKVDKLLANKALYVPEEGPSFTAYLDGDVRIETNDALKVKTGNIVYTKKTEMAEADQLVEFERENIKGRAIGATVDVGSKRLELLRDVEVEMTGGVENGRADIRNALFKGGSAVFDQAADVLEVRGGVESRIVSTDDKITNIKASRAAIALVRERKVNSSITSVELFDNVWIDTTGQDRGRTTIETAYAKYDRPSDRFDLKNGVRIVTGEPDSADIRAGEAIFERSAGKIFLNGGAEITRGGVYLKGNSMTAALSGENKVRSASVSGSAFLRNTSNDCTTEISADELDAAFDTSQQVEKADAKGNVNAVLLPEDNSNYSRVTVSSPTAIRSSFRAGGILDKMKTDGRTTIQLDVPNDRPDAANKRVTADTVHVLFNQNGKDIKRAEAVGNAELNIRPITASSENYNTTIFAPRFDCQFYETGNNARSCVGVRGTKTLREPNVARENRGTQTLLADELEATFSQTSRDIERLDARRSVKFTELDRNVIAAAMTYTETDRIVRMRGGEPTYWDSQARAKAPEIDWDIRNDRSYLRGGVSTTYYNRRKTNDATPFGDADKPVFTTSSSAEIDHRSETAVFIGTARAWQNNNYVRADKLVVDQRNGRFFAEGSVQSALYEARQVRKSGSTNVPVFASAASLSFDRGDRILRYRQAVDMRQGTDRVNGEIADIYLNDRNELVKAIVENKVVVTQPGRRATGDWVQYSAEDEVAVIRGNPASVEDRESGTSQSGEITMNLRDNRVISEGKTKQNPSARTRSVYKVRSTQ